MFCLPLYPHPAGAILLCFGSLQKEAARASALLIENNTLKKRVAFQAHQLEVGVGMNPLQF